MRIGIALATLTVCAGLAAADGPASGNRTETRSEKLAFGSKLWVKNRNGAIKVVGWDKEEVSLVAQIRDTPKRKIDLVVQHVGADLDIEAQFQQPVVVFSFGFAPSPRCEMTLSVPRRVMGHFRTTNGPVTVASLDGYARCETTNGDVVIRDLKGECLAETTNGALEAYNLKARIKGGTTNGRIRLEDVEGGIQVETTNGGIVARNLDGWGEGIRLESTNGGIEVVLGKATGDIHAENSNGGIDIKVAGATVVESAKHSARVKVPGREQKITLETTNGGITVR
ncbi:MAG: DUF4097 family beta strand repeat protein [Holophaga sp.]|nr:DUF4097 family beta strand repeat protein [Holophaga sp.]